MCMETFGHDYDEDENTAHIPVLWATDRMVVNGKLSNLSNENGELHYGGVLGEVDKTAGDWRWKLILSEPIGVLARLIPWVGKFVKHFSPVTLYPREGFQGTPAEQLAQLIREIKRLARLQGRQAPKIVLFEHGMDQSFDDAAWRAVIQGYFDRAQKDDPNHMGYIIVFYAWSAVGHGIPSYDGDGDESEKTVVAFRDNLLRPLVDEFGAKNIVLVSHSMGGRILGRALRGWVPKTADDKFMAVLMVAPDVDFGVFDICDRQFMLNATQGDPVQREDRIIVFGSKKDMLLLLSKVIHMSFTDTRLPRRAWTLGDLPRMFFRWLFGQQPAYQVRRLEGEKPRLGQPHELPARRGVLGVEYGAEDELPWGHTMPYDKMAALLLCLEQGVGVNGFIEKYGKPLVDDPDAMRVVVLKPMARGYALVPFNHRTKK